MQKIVFTCNFCKSTGYLQNIFVQGVQKNLTPFNSALFCNWGGVYVLCAKTTSKIFSEAEKFNFWSQQIKKNLVTMNFEGFHFRFF